MTATEASRRFSALLDDVARGEAVIITRGGQRVAIIEPAGRGNGRDVLALHEGSPDPSYADDIEAARLGTNEDELPWHD